MAPSCAKPVPSVPDAVPPVSGTPNGKGRPAEQRDY
jgi:hypothetical protein